MLETYYSCHKANVQIGVDGIIAIVFIMLFGFLGNHKAFLLNAGLDALLNIHKAVKSASISSRCLFPRKGSLSKLLQ
jgi:hypothetical protein